MKYLFLICIVFFFGGIGFHQKYKFINRKNLLNEIKNYIQFYDSHLSVFKDDLYKINNKYKIMQENKSANNQIIYLKNANIFNFNYILLKKSLSKINEYDLIVNYLKSIGSLEYNEEKIKNSEMIEILNCAIKKSELDIKNKGELRLKVLLAIGAVVAIILW